MKRTYNFATLCRAEKILSMIVEYKEDVAVMNKPSETDSLLKIIYAKDQFNLPCGDITYFVNPKANPEVKKFILDNLMMDVSGVAAPKNDAIDNDTAFALMRRDGESVDDYMIRINEFGRAQSDFVYGALNNKDSGAVTE